MKSKPSEIDRDGRLIQILNPTDTLSLIITNRMLEGDLPSEETCRKARTGLDTPIILGPLKAAAFACRQQRRNDFARLLCVRAQVCFSRLQTEWETSHPEGGRCWVARSSWKKGWHHSVSGGVFR